MEDIVSFREEILRLVRTEDEEQIANVFLDIFSELLASSMEIAKGKEALKSELKSDELLKRDVKEILSLVGLTRIST